MWKAIFCFELKYHLRQPLFYLAALVLFLFALLLASTEVGMSMSHAPATVYRNAPFTIIKPLTFLTALGLFVITAFVASSVLRDFERGIHPLFFTKPVTKLNYLLGRFAGSMALSLALFTAPALGLLVGNFMPWQDPDRVGPLMIGPYVYGLLVMVLPNLLVMGAIFFALAILSRRLLVTYIGVVVFLGLQDWVEELGRDFENQFLGSLIEPLGLVALDTGARYWTVIEYNTALPGLSAALVGNRLLWLGVAGLILAWGATRFSYSQAASRRVSASSTAAIPDATPALGPPQTTVLKTRPRFATGIAWRQWLRQTRLETAAVVHSAPFLVLLALGLMFIFGFALVIGQNRGTPVYPVTHLMLEAIRLTLQMILTITVVFYAGELVWKERDLRLAGVSDALPVPAWVFLGAKLTALVLVVAIFIATGVLSTIAVQLAGGYFDLELGLYAKGFLAVALPFVWMAVLAIFLQVVANHKFIGYLLAIVFLAARFALGRLGFQHHLYRYATPDALPYSDMNGYGHYAEPFFWFHLYWAFTAVLLVALTAVLWVRGAESTLKSRRAAIRERWRGPIRVGLAVGAVGLLTTGSFIFYNTNVLAEYLPHGKRIRRAADYEKNYRRYLDAALPRITAVYADVDIFPRERRVEIRGRYQLANRGEEPIRILPVTMRPRFTQGLFQVDSGVTLDEIDLGGHRVELADEELDFYVYELTEALAPGETRELRFTVSVRNPGFKNHRFNDQVVANGTFFSNKNFFPALGYNRGNELLNPTRRRRHGLPPPERMAKLDDLAARDKNYLDADWIAFETVVSTTAEQIAVAPGDLQGEWIEGDRRYFHYKTNVPIINLVCYISADYQVRKDRWHDVAIEVYYHAGHPYNIDRMIDTVKKSLDYFTVQYGPYPHRQLRLLEIPRYHGETAVSLANTIPFSEAAGFIIRPRASDVDMMAFFTAHEVAHQWWNHQVIGAGVQGATMIAEAMSEYSALMVMEKLRGPEHVRHLLKYELDRYLEYRSRDPIGEMPLLLVEDQAYIHYYKGSLVMYALQDYIGEEALNQALRRFLEAQTFQGPPYVTSPELL
ncbi:MAG: hypothetical protein GY856_14695, partial [bacterium]|nr:hypothetical protein [bacterium]